MSEDQARQAQIKYLFEKADQALSAARRELEAGDLDLALNRVYYACFYSASAILLQDKRHFVKHAGLRTAVHKYLVNPGRVSPVMGKVYDTAFDERHKADYGPWVRQDSQIVASRIEKAAEFVTTMKGLLQVP